MTAGKKTRKPTREETFLAEMRAAAEPHWEMTPKCVLLWWMF